MENSTVSSQFYHQKYRFFFFSTVSILKTLSNGKLIYENRPPRRFFLFRAHAVLCLIGNFFLGCAVLCNTLQHTVHIMFSSLASLSQSLIDLCLFFAYFVLLNPHDINK